MNFGRKAEHLNEIFECIRLNPTGSSLLARFLPLFKAGAIQISAMESTKLSVKGMTGAAASAFVFDGKKRQILLDMSYPIGIVAPMLVHEIVHSMDLEYLAEFALNQQLWHKFESAASTLLKSTTHKVQKKISEIQIEDIEPSAFFEIRVLKDHFEKHDHNRVFKSEIKAYGQMLQWTREFEDLFPDYSAFLAQARSEGHLIGRHLSEKEIIERYRLNTKWLNTAA